MKKLDKDLYFDKRGYVGRLHNTTGNWEHRLSKSKYGVIRGFHGDNKTQKIVFCLSGAFQLVVYDPVKNYKWSMILSETSHGVIIPPGYLNAHQCLTETCLLYYAWDHPYDGADAQWSIHYNDETINPNWSLLPNEELISDRDINAPKLKDTKLE